MKHKRLILIIIGATLIILFINRYSDEDTTADSRPYSTPTKNENSFEYKYFAAIFFIPILNNYFKIS